MMQNAPIIHALSSVEDRQFQEFDNNEWNLKKLLLQNFVQSTKK